MKRTWLVKAWCTAPGEFPSRSLESVRVAADPAFGIGRVVARATRRFEQGFLNPQIVYIERVVPPFQKDQ